MPATGRGCDTVAPELRSAAQAHPQQSRLGGLAGGERSRHLPAVLRRIHERRNGGAANATRGNSEPSSIRARRRHWRGARHAKHSSKSLFASSPSRPGKADWNCQGCRLLRLGAGGRRGVLRNLGTGQLLSFDWQQPAPSRSCPRDSSLPAHFARQEAPRKPMAAAPRRRSTDPAGRRRRRIATHRCRAAKR